MQHGHCQDAPVDPSRIDELMAIALEEARDSLEHGDVPIGAVVVRRDTGEIVARRHNERELQGDPTAHAEILALRDAADSIGQWRLDDGALVVTLEPGPMCGGAAINARVGLLAFGAADPKAGATGSLYNLAADPRLNHEMPVISGVQADAAATLLRDFFAGRR
jgi:tRNA(adenine34) deaminase